MPSRTQRLRTRRPPLAHRLAEVSIRVLAYSAVAAMILIFIFIAKEAWPLLTSAAIHKEVTLAKMWFIQQWPGYDAPEHVWQPVSEIPKFGVWPLVVGTIKVTLIAMIVAVPLAVSAAVFVSQYASRRVREIVKPAIEFLAGIPSVVLGFFALMVMASWFQSALGLDSRLNAIVAGVALSFAVIPVIFTVCEEALGAVPASYVEASVALGAARWQSITRVVLPAAAPGIAASIALGLGRAFGETMIVLMASGNAAIISTNPADSVRTLSATIAAELAEVVFGGPHYTVLFALAVLLFIITFGINFAGDQAIARMKRRMGVAP
jgi:phosphate transport system permease protein